MPDSPYPTELKWVGRFKGKGRVFFRPILPQDLVLLEELFHSHSAGTIYSRYFCALHELSPDQLDRFLNVNYRTDMAIVGLVPFDGRQKMICVGRYFKNPNANEAEFAITLHDEWQHHGLGTFLMRKLIEIAGRHGIERLTADVLASNHAMLGVLRKCVKKWESTREAGVYRVSFSVGKANVLPAPTRAHKKHFE